MKLGDIVLKYRTDHDLSQRQFALMCGLSNGTISNLEKGVNPNSGKPITPSLDLVRKLASTMGLTLTELLVQADDMPIALAEEGGEIATFGEKLRAARKAKRLTQKQLALLIKAAHNSISNWENDQNMPDPDTIQHLCWALNVEPNYFFSQDPQKEKLYEVDDIVEVGDQGMAAVDDSPVVVTGQAGYGKSQLINQYVFFREAKEVAEARQGNANILRMAGRDGTFIERVLTDDQMAAIKAMLNAMPDASGDL